MRLQKLTADMYPPSKLKDIKAGWCASTLDDLQSACQARKLSAVHGPNEGCVGTHNAWCGCEVVLDKGSLRSTNTSTTKL